MKMSAMADAWAEQGRMAEIDELSFDERFSMLVDAEHLSRENRRLGRLLKEAKLRIPSASMANLKTGAQHGLEKSLATKLGSCGWLDEHLNVLITGPTGVGKTYLACALGHQACRRGYRVLYRRLPRLVDELSLARADGTYGRLLARYERAHLLIIDDWGIGPLKAQHQRDILEIIEDRYQRSSTLLTSQLPISQWHDYIGDPTVADAILDRLVHSAYKCQLKGPSRRKEMVENS